MDNGPLAFALGGFFPRVLCNFFTPISVLVTKFVTKIFCAVSSEKLICQDWSDMFVDQISGG